MHRFYLFLIVILSTLSFTSCDKQVSDQLCSALKDSFASNNQELVKLQMQQLITGIPPVTGNSFTHLDAAVQKLNSCGMNASVVCYGCIQTLPEQSEVNIHFSYRGNTIHYILDFSTAASTGKLVFLNYHE